MKKTGIITFHCADNFGAFLQVYALQTAITKIGIDVEVIDFRPEDIVASYQMNVNISKLIKEEGAIRTLKMILAKIYYYNSIRNRSKKFESSRNKYLHLSEDKYFTSEELINNPPFYDYYIAGSDQVWNPTFIEKNGYSYLLDFVQGNSSKISYAASIAEYSEKDEIKKIYKQNLSEFDYISVREQSAQEYLENFITNEIYVHLDPTFLIEKEEWSKLSLNIHFKYKYILVYDLQSNNEIIDLANKISEKYGYKIISYSKPRNYSHGTKSFKYEGPEEFIGLIENAELIISSSYHGIVFSIIYNKPFYAIPHKLRGSRIIDLLNTLNLSDRIAYKSSVMENFDLMIDYSYANKIIKNNTRNAMKYLKNVLDKD